MDMQKMGADARQASYQLAMLNTAQKNQALEAIAVQLEQNVSAILAANGKDIEAGRANGLSDALLDRLLLDEGRLAGIIADLRHVIALPDPVGEVIDGCALENGLRLSRRRVPLGVVGTIYEARPNVTIDVAGLCLKTGNAVIMRGGKETIHSNLVLIEQIQAGLENAGLPATAIQYIRDPDRRYVAELLKLDQYVDMIIPRGGAGLHQLCKEQSTIPVITGGIGICHMFVDESAHLDKAVALVENAKVQRPSVCNALDTVLVHQAVAQQFLPKLAQTLAQSKVIGHAEGEAKTWLEQGGMSVEALKAGDFDQEWVSLNLNAKIVADLDEAIAHIRQHTSQHSEAILTQSLHNAERFTHEVDAAAVYVNASTRFTDGGQFGLGAEVAVSTQKLHARGPMGLEALTTYKWIGIGDDLIRA
ncbi:Gamma-glutamyl phosphate reductase [Vibrio stylophorae]|uniref:Gamma-glutamyl phosphate reductase n=1 Tax=Vibrio stylophorae TaxID=659351 RepID=A0ABM8ZUN7_9VIBR|nr:glutamate-5-semialdehyde dehydrogenase [Vibrio stylophorae]CAH0534045.1 Gamma-glutamyl phosphate reductase [Vibrio stylophorae]